MLLTGQYYFQAMPILNIIFISNIVKKCKIKQSKQSRRSSEESTRSITKHLFGQNLALRKFSKISREFYPKCFTLPFPPNKNSISEKRKDNLKKNKRWKVEKEYLRHPLNHKINLSLSLPLVTSKMIRSQLLHFSRFIARF